MTQEPINVLVGEILQELKDSGLNTVIEAWGWPHFGQFTHCITCEHSLHLYITEEQITLSWKVREKWHEEKWDIRQPNSIEQAIYWFNRRHQIYDIIKHRDSV